MKGMFTGGKNSQMMLASLMQKTLIDIFFEQKNIDISESIDAIYVRNDVLFIKVRSPLVRTELIGLSGIIEQQCRPLFDTIGVQISQIRYIG